MITYLQTHMRRHGKILLILVMGIMIVSLLYYGPARRSGSQRGGMDYQIYGRTIPKADFETAKDAFAFLLSLQYGRPIHRNEVDNEQGIHQILLNLAMAEKAHLLGIRVTDEEVGQQIRAMPVFQENGQFSEQKFNEILSTELSKRHLSEKDLQEIVSQRIALARLNDLISRTALVTPKEVNDYLHLINEKLDISVAKFNEKNFKPSAPPPDDQLRAFYKENAEKFRIPKKIKVEYVEFPVPQNAGAPASDEELKVMYQQNMSRMAGPDGTVRKFEEMKPILVKAVAQQRQQETVNQVGRVATDFSLKFATEGKEKPDFKTVAAEQHLATKETDYVGGPADLKMVKVPEQFATEVLKLSKENPVSLPIVGGDVIYVAYWLDTRESTVPDFAQVKEKVLELWKDDAAKKLARETGKTARTKFGQLLAEGKTFEQATKSLGLTWDNLQPFSLREITSTDPARFFKQSAFGLRAGTAGDFQPDPDGGFFVYVKSRQPADIVKLEEQRPEISTMMERNTQNVTLYEFRRKVLEESGLMPLFAEAEAAESPDSSM